MATPFVVRDNHEKAGFWVRLASINQLSQGGRITREDGFLNGQTLEYLGFLFVPRFLWPEKPIIQKGGWFAWRIGQAWIRADGCYSNAFNMTVPGELCLNGAGVLIGCTLFVAFVALLWSRTAFWSRHPSAVSAAFGYYLFWTSLTLASDLQTVVTLIATCYIFVVAGVALRTLPNPGRRLQGPVSVPWHLSVRQRAADTSAT